MDNYINLIINVLPKLSKGLSQISKEDKIVNKEEIPLYKKLTSSQKSECQLCGEKLKIHKSKLNELENYPEMFVIDHYEGNKRNLLEFCGWSKDGESVYVSFKCPKCILKLETSKFCKNFYELLNQ